jgi:DNA-binding beta-propeller fold protein YncE
MLERLGEVELPPHAKLGSGFDHAAVHVGRAHVYVAHTANDALDVIDGRTHAYRRSIAGLTGIAGVLVSEERDLVFTSNRGEHTVGIFAPDREAALAKVAVGVRPNGLAYDAHRDILLAANVGDGASPGSFTVSVVDVGRRTRITDVPVAGRTRWAVFDADLDCFYVNIADPPQIVVIEGRDPSRLARTIAVPAAGPHGLDLDVAGHRLFCACDDRRVLTLDARSGAVVDHVDIVGVPDVVFFNPKRQRLYVAIGDPGVIEVLETTPLRRREVVATGRGAHTLAFDPASETLYAFLPETHRAAVYRDRP